MLISGPLRFRSLGASNPPDNPADPDRDSDNEVNALRGAAWRGFGDDGIIVGPAVSTPNLNVMLLQNALIAVGALTAGAASAGLVDQATQAAVGLLVLEVKHHAPQGDEVSAVVATASVSANAVLFAQAIRQNVVGLTHYALRLAQLKAALKTTPGDDPFVDSPAPHGGGSTPVWWYVVGGLAALGAVGLIVHLLRKGARPQYPAIGWGHYGPYGPWTPPRLR